MLIGYARTSTVDQTAGLESQERDLRAAGVETLFVEQVSSVAERAELRRALAEIRHGDVFVVTKLDRLARSVAHLLEIVDALAAKGATLRILGMGVDTATPTGRLMLQVLGAVAEFERAIMLERQREGIAKAKAAGKYRGRAPTARAKRDDVLRRIAAGETRESAARAAGISLASVYRILRTRDNV